MSYIVINKICAGVVIVVMSHVYKLVSKFINLQKTYKNPLFVCNISRCRMTVYNVAKYCYLYADIDFNSLNLRDVLYIFNGGSTGVATSANTERLTLRIRQFILRMVIVLMALRTTYAEISTTHSIV